MEIYSIAQNLRDQACFDGARNITMLYHMAAVIIIIINDNRGTHCQYVQAQQRHSLQASLHSRVTTGYAGSWRDWANCLHVCKHGMVHNMIVPADDDIH